MLSTSSTFLLPLLLLASSVSAAHDSNNAPKSRRRHHARLASSSSPSAHSSSPSSPPSEANAAVVSVSAPIVARADTVFGWTSQGCVVDAYARALSGWSQSSSSWTLDSCLSTCDDKGFTYAGMEWGTECYCGNEVNALGSVGGLLGDLLCSMECSDGSMCGGWFSLSLYQKSTSTSSSTSALASASATVAPTATATSAAAVSTSTSAWTNQGCVSDGSTRSLTGYAETNYDGWTVDECVSTCQSKGFAMAGIEVGTECYCGNSFNTAANTYHTSAWECTWYCFGTPDVCGGPWRLSIFSDQSIANLLDGSSDSSTTTSTSVAATATLISTSTSTSTSTSVTSTSTSTSVAVPTTSSAVASTSTTSTAVAPVSTVTVPSSSGTKASYVHFMVGNAYPYTYATWLNDVKLASAAGFDGFALNIGTDSWQWTQVASAYQAAQDSGTGFKMFLSFDMTVLPCSSYDNAAALRSYITTYAAHPNQAWYGGKILASTFAGSDCTFGQGGWTAGWQTAFKDVLSNAGTPVYFMPSVFTDPSTFGSASAMDGELNWNSGWPMGGDDLDFSSDTTYMNALGSKGYMAAVSPVFFTHYGVNSWNKNWIFRSDNWLYASRWETLVANRDKFDLIEALTWNDYGESSYIGPIEGAQPNSQAWVDGYDHTALLDISLYYATAFKTGVYPAITTDKIYLTARPHPVYAVATSDSVPSPNYREYSDDNFYALIFATSACTVTLTSGAGSQTTAVAAGVTRLSYALATGSGMSATISRNGADVVSHTPDFTFVVNPATYNFNYVFTQSS